MSNHNNIRCNDHTGAHVAHGALFNDHYQTKSKSVDTHHSNNNESMDVQQPNMKDCRCSHHHFIPTQIFLLVLLFVAINFSFCSCGHNYPHYSVTDEVSISNNVAINQDFSIMAVSTSDDTCGVAERSSDNHARNEVVLDDNAPLFALLGVDWEMLAPLHNLEYSLKSAGTEMILHPMATYNQQRCERPGPTLNDHRCSKLDGTHLNQCSPTDHNDQDSNTSSSFCPLQNSKYLHLYTHRYTMISTMKGLLLSDDIISIIVHQKMLQLQPKFFPLIFWLMVIGLTFSCFHVSGTNYHDNINCSRLSSIQHSSCSISSQSSNDNKLRPMDSDSTFFYHTASNKYYGNIIPSESESDLELFQASIPVSSGADHDHACATVLPKRDSLLHGIALPHWENEVCEQMQPLNEDSNVYPYDVAILNPESIITFSAPVPSSVFGDNSYQEFQEDYPLPIQETQGQSIQ